MKAPDVVLEIDHVIPKSLGGDHAPGNLLTACRDCNRGKSSSQLSDTKVEELSDRAAHYALTMRNAAKAMQADYDDFAEWYEPFEESWNKWVVKDTKTRIPLPADHRVSLFQWWRAGLPFEAVEDAVSIAMTRGVKTEDTWRYFAGVIWRMFDDYELSINVRGVESSRFYTQQEYEEHGVRGWEHGFVAGWEAEELGHVGAGAYKAVRGAA